MILPNACMRVMTTQNLSPEPVVTNKPERKRHPVISERQCHGFQLPEHSLHGSSPVADQDNVSVVVVILVILVFALLHLRIVIRFVFAIALVCG